MGFDYFKEKEWKDISRDERRFCADLVFQLKDNKTEREFVEWLINSPKLKDIREFNEIEIDFEVCFYRDLIFEFTKSDILEDKSAIKGLLKRTFDICIFLPDQIIIIEAKAAQGMNKKQLIEFSYDKRAIEICFDKLGLPKKKIYLVGLASENYLENKKNLMTNNSDYFDRIISWEEIARQGQLAYKQRDKLKIVYNETQARKKKVNKIRKADNNLISQLEKLTEEMTIEINKNKRKK